MYKIPFYIAIVAVFSAFVPQSDARTLNRKEFRKYTGLYRGSMDGVYGEADSSGYYDFGPFFFDADIRIHNRRLERVPSATGRLHTLRYSKPKGNNRRAKLRGIFVGSFYNPISDTYEPVLGGRIIKIKDKGASSRFHYLMSVKETIEEYGLSYMDVDGRFGKN